MRRSVRILTALAVAATMLLPQSAGAGHTCNSDVIVFSGVVLEGNEPPFLNSNAVRCAVGSDAEDVYDGRIINPGSNAIYVRYTPDLGVAIDEVTVTLDGLGYDDVVPAVREEHVLGGFNYNTATLPIDPAASGTIEAVVTLDGIELGRTTFRTIDS